MTDTARALALTLFSALLREVAEWADDAESSWAASLHSMPPAQALASIQEHSAAPSHLFEAVTDVLLHLDPATYNPAPTSTHLAPSPPATAVEPVPVRWGGEETWRQQSQDGTTVYVPLTDATGRPLVLALDGDAPEILAGMLTLGDLPIEMEDAEADDIADPTEASPYGQHGHYQVDAVFVPATSDPDSVPVLRVAGIDTAVYVDPDGVVNIAIDTDSADRALRQGPDERLPMELVVNGYLIRRY